MSLLKKLASETALYGLSSILGRLLTFVFLTPFLTYIFNEDRAQMGIQTDIYAWAAFLMVLFSYRMETAFFRFGNKEEDRAKAYKTATTAIVVTTTALVLIMIALSQWIANELGYPDHADYVVWFAFILGFDALTAIPFAMLRLEGKAKKFAFIKLLNLFVHLGFVWFFLYILPNYLPQFFDKNMGIGYVFLANLIASAVTFVQLLPTYRYKIISKDKEIAPAVFDKALFREMFFYAMPLVLAGLAGIVNEVLDRILLKALLPGDPKTVLEQLGVYGSCYKIAIFMNLFTQAFNYAAEPFFFRNADKEYSRQLYADVAFLFALIGCVGFLAIMLLMDIVQYFVGPNYREGLMIVPILLLANLFLGLYYNLSVWFKLSNQTKYAAIISFIGAAITIISNLALIPLMIQWGYPGYLGSAWATLFCYGSMTAAAYYWGQKHYPVPYPFLRIITYICIAIAIYKIDDFWVKSYFSEYNLWGYIISVALLIIYVLIIYVLDGRKIRGIIKYSPVE